MTVGVEVVLTVGNAAAVLIGVMRVQSVLDLAPVGETVAEIAERCGYSCLPRFFTEFRQRTGTSPAAYRARFRPP